MANLTRDDIIKLAALAQIHLTDEEISEFTDEFASILEYVQQLDAVDTTGLLPTSQVTGLQNVQREDVVIDYGYEPKAMLANSPAVQGDQLKVRRMVG